MKANTNEFDPRIDAALDTYPPAPVPSGIVQRAMRQIRTQSQAQSKPQFRAKPRFRLEFLDIVIPAFTAFFALVVGALILWMLNHLDPLWTLKVRAWLQYVSLYATIIQPLPVIAAGIGGATLLLGGLLALALWIERDMPHRVL